MTKKWLISWVGGTDLLAGKGELKDGQLGPLASALIDKTAGEFDRVYLLTNYNFAETQAYCRWMEQTCGYADSKVDLYEVELSSPIAYDEIYAGVCKELKAAHLPSDDIELTFHLSPGTPAMATVWIALSRTRFPAKLIQTSPKQTGGLPVNFQFDLTNAFLPEFFQRDEERVEHLQRRIADQKDPAFKDVLHASERVSQQIDLARRYAIYPNTPVLIFGETGTGKELFARAVHDSSPRADKTFVVVNCGAIPRELANAELFGYKKGAFTGASENRKGYFEVADGGTLFLDEIGELPLDSQVRLLRVLQEREVTPVGSTTPIKVDVRIVAATHRLLERDVADGKFREDLFFRLAGGILRLPPLREREGDLDMLVDHFMNIHNEDAVKRTGTQQKKLSPEARNVIAGHTWPGNIRELQSTLLRAAVWSQSELITERDMQAAILKLGNSENQVLERPVTQGFSLQEVLDEVSRHYIEKAFRVGKGRKSKAAKLLGFDNYQTLDNWTKKLGLSFDDAVE